MFESHHERQIDGAYRLWKKDREGLAHDQRPGEIDYLLSAKAREADMSNRRRGVRGVLLKAAIQLRNVIC